MTKIADQKIIVKMVFKTPENDDGYSSLGLIDHATLSAIGAGIIDEFCYTVVQQTQAPHVYITPIEGDMKGNKAIAWAHNLRNLVVVMNNVVRDHNGFYEKAN